MGDVIFLRPDRPAPLVAQPHASLGGALMLERIRIGLIEVEAELETCRREGYPEEICGSLEFAWRRLKEASARLASHHAPNGGNDVAIPPLR